MRIKNFVVVLSTIVFSIVSFQVLASASDDSTLVGRIKAKLNSDSMVSELVRSNRITVNVKDGVVTITGNVRTADQKTAIETDVKSVNGVASVDTNSVKVKGNAGSAKKPMSGTSPSTGNQGSSTTDGGSSSY